MAVDRVAKEFLLWREQSEESNLPLISVLNEGKSGACKMKRTMPLTKGLYLLAAACLIIVSQVEKCEGECGLWMIDN